MKTKPLLFIVILVSLFGSVTESFSTEKLIIEGHDPVAYFTVGKPVKGLKDFAYQWMGGTYRFSSKENLELFKKG